MRDIANDNMVATPMQRLADRLSRAMVDAYYDGLGHFEIGEAIDEIRVELDIRLYAYPDPEPVSAWNAFFDGGGIA